ncbi:hypothetical protein LLEC1_05839 [Akanthomyces lecanii]|uniref:Mid2 domain-containing protein n=1 Tax=Cordyceps confragosa TaxID=2714763 RepID=A0A179I5V3_CORDF|nr:hypothetical protein LLEC1_05839 [Akanthomyces lecanii]
MAAQVTDNPKFEGWYFHPDGTIEPLTCPQGTYTTSGTYAACCEKSKCAMPTACHDNIISYDNHAVASCPQSAVCQTMSIMSAPGAQGDVTSSIFCAQYWYAIQAYRDTVPVTTSASTTKTKTSSSSGSTPASNSASMTTSLSSSSTTPSAAGSSGATSPTSTPEPSSGSSSKAWIAGAVVGPIAGLALIGFAFWFLRRRSAKNKVSAADAPQEIGGYERPAGNGDGNYNNKGYYGAAHPKAENTSAGYYAPVEQNQVHELPSGEHR